VRSSSRCAVASRKTRRFACPKEIENENENEDDWGGDQPKSEELSSWRDPDAGLCSWAIDPSTVAFLERRASGVVLIRMTQAREKKPEVDDTWWHGQTSSGKKSLLGFIGYLLLMGILWLL
jgi:hypothetical protein